MQRVFLEDVQNPIMIINALITASPVCLLSHLNDLCFLFKVNTGKISSTDDIRQERRNKQNPNGYLTSLMPKHMGQSSLGYLTQPCKLVYT